MKTVFRAAEMRERYREFPCTPCPCPQPPPLSVSPTGMEHLLQSMSPHGHMTIDPQLVEYEDIKPVDTEGQLYSLY